MAQQEPKYAWKTLEERMGQKLLQLTNLVDHFASYPSDGSEVAYQGLAEQNDCEIEEILKETASRIRIFKTDLEIQIQERKTQEFVKEAKAMEESMKRVAEQKYQTFEREIMQLKSELSEQAEKSKQSEQLLKEMHEKKEQREQEIEEEQKRHKEELAVITDRCQRQVEATEHIFANREMQSQDQAKREITQSVEVLKAVHAEEIEHMKMENKEYVEQLCKKHSALELSLRKKEASIKKELEISSQEKDSIHQDMDALRLQLREAHDMLQDTSLRLAETKDLKGALEISYSTLKRESSDTIEKLRVSLKDVQTVSTSLESEKKKAVEMRAAYTSTIGALESKTLALQKDVTNLTTACALTEEELQQHKKKVDELQFTLATSRKDHNNALMEVRRLREEVRTANDALAKAEGDLTRKEAEAITKCNALSAEISALQLERLAQSEQTANHVKELMELKLKQQMSNHESTMNSVHRAYLLQLDEQKKGAKVQCASLEESIRKKWKQSEAKAKDDYAKFAQAFEMKLEQQRSRSADLIALYEGKVSKLQENLESLESVGNRLGNDFQALQKQAIRQAQESKQMCSALTRQLKDSQRKCEQLQQSLCELQIQYESKTEEQAAVIENVRVELDQHVQAAALSSKQEESLISEIKELKEKLLGTQLEHGKKLELTIQTYEADLSELRKKSKMEEDDRNAKFQDTLQCHFDRETAELHAEMRRSAQQHERIILEQKASLCAAAEEHKALVLAHQLELEMLSKKSEEENKAHVDALSAAEAMSTAVTEVSQKAWRDLELQRREHSLQIQELAERHEQEMAQLQNEWRHRFEMKERQDNQKHEIDLAELRQTQRRWYSLEKDKIIAENKRIVNQFQIQIGDLEKSAAQQDLRVSRMDAENKLLMEQLTSAQHMNQELAENLEQQISTLQRDFRLRTDELQSQHAAEFDACRDRHNAEIACIQQEFESSKASLTDSLQKVQVELEKLQERFYSKESNPADLRQIADLQKTCAKKDTEYQKLYDEARTLKLEIVNREENYNKVFGNSPVVLQGAPGWFKPKCTKDSTGRRMPNPVLKQTPPPHSMMRTPDRAASQTPDASSSNPR